MRLRRILPLAVAVGVLMAPAAPAAVDRGVPFGRAPDHAGRDHVLRMDLHLPRGAAAGRRAPAIVWVHGGGFVRGHRRMMEPFAASFARWGYVAATIDYRLAPAHDLEAPGRPPAVRAAQHDAQAAVRFLRRHARSLGVDRSRIHIAGSSAGGMTALNVGLHPGDPGDSGNPGPSSRVRAAVSLAGFAPVEAIDATDPPLLLLHGTADTTIPFAWAERTCVMAAEGGARCELVAFPEAGHRLTWERTDELAARVAHWLAALG